jgi:hypothetical protein
VGSTHPYYRRRRPVPQNADDFVRDVGIGWIVKRLLLVQVSADPGLSVTALMKIFPPSPPGSVRALVANMLIRGGVCPHIDLLNAHIDAFGVADPVAATRALVDKRAAAAIFAAVSPQLGVRLAPIIKWVSFDPLGLGGDFWPLRPFHVDDTTGVMSSKPGEGLYSFRALLEMKYYGRVAATVYHPTAKCLGAMAYGDYFPGDRANQLRALVSDALLRSSPGWCGTFGPGVGTSDLISDFLQGNYDMTQQHLLRTAYAYFDELTPAAREHLISALLARGRIHRVNLDDTFTSGGPPNDWSRAGYVSPAGMHDRIGETENHILMINTARYLSNQLMYQRHRHVVYDNRRNGSHGAPSCLDLLLYLLRNILRDDFSEYNAKPYQHETRTALLNLCSFAYDHEVRLAARMVLDYVSAHMAVSSNDCRRMVPFRRRNEKEKVTRTIDGKMRIGLLESQRGADPMAEHMAMLSGATRGYEFSSEPHRPFAWSIASNGGYSTYEMLSDYRMPALIHDLFVNDLHRRFVQVLNRRDLDDAEVTGRNANNSELFAGSPSYLISAGGSPGPHAIDPYFGFVLIPNQEQQLGVAMPSSFMPTGDSAGNNPAEPHKAFVGFQTNAANLIQVGRFAQEGQVKSYGVAADFLCGPHLELPPWCSAAIESRHRRGKFDFVNKRGPDGKPGFYLAILRDREFAIIEAFDTWRDPSLGFSEFRDKVWERNQQLSETGVKPFEKLTYKTQNGNRIRFMMWNEDDGDDLSHGAYIYAGDDVDSDPMDKMPVIPREQFLGGDGIEQPQGSGRRDFESVSGPKHHPRHERSAQATARLGGERNRSRWRQSGSLARFRVGWARHGGRCPHLGRGFFQAVPHAR